MPYNLSHSFCPPPPLLLLRLKSQRYTIDHVMQDHLIIGFPSEKANPYREKTWSCQVL